MKRLIRLIGVGLLLCVMAFTEPFEEGKHYQRAPKDVGTHSVVQDLAKEEPQKIQVIEFFSYGCSWCYKLDPYIEKWYQHAPDYVHFQRVPVEFQPAWGALTKAYFTAVDLKELEKIHSGLFEAINNEKLTNTAEETLGAFFVSKGIRQEEFNKIFNSFDVSRKQKWANAVSRAYRITAIPAVVVQGPKGVFVTTLRMAGSEETFLKIVDYLVQIQKEERGIKEQSK